ncbi:retrovirus-related pol polyprotein from transposon TNT 1-94 [Tanacetum coccineum]
MWLKGMVNKDGEFTDDEIRSVGDKLKEADDKTKEGTLNLDDGTDAMTVVFGKEKGGYARGVESGVTYKRYFHLPRSRQATDERIELLQTQLDNERRERQQKDELVKKLSTEMTEKDVLVNKLSNEMTETKGMLSQLMNQLAAQGVQLNLSSQLQVASDVTPMGAYEVDGTQSSVVVRDKDARIQKKSNGLVTSEKEPVKTVGPKKTPKSRRNGSQDSQLQGNVSPTQELPTASKCKLWHLKKSNIVALGTVYKSDGKQMLHNQALPNDCYKVSIDSSLVDATCIPDVGNNGLKTVKDGVDKEKGVAITDVEDSSRIVRPVRSITTLQPLPNIDPKDKEGYNLLLWGDLKLWSSYITNGWYFDLLQHASREKYPLIKEMLQKMLNWKLEAEAESTMAFELLKFINLKKIRFIGTLGEKGIDCNFVGYAEHSKAYRFYVIEPNESVSINSIIESRDAIFDENRLSSIPRQKDIIPNSVESQRDDHFGDVPNETPEPHREAIDDEIGTIMENNTWVLSDLPHGCKPLGCKWIFKRKMKVDGTIDKFKARLVI